MAATATDRIVTIAKGDVSADFLPAVGGALARLRWRTADLLRPAPLDCSDPREAACFPLAPFANRIAHACFSFDGRHYQLPASRIAAPHALHGFGWQRAWTVADHRPDQLVLTLDYEGPEWPWATRLRQRCALGPRGAELSLSIVNRSDRPMPAGLGFHPYFQRSAETCLTAKVDGGWYPDDRGIAGRWSARPRRLLGGGRPVEALAPADLCCERWDGSARVTGGKIPVTLAASANLSCLHIYAPPGADYFCAEPVNHAPDALNRNDVPPPPALGPGESLEISLRIEAREALKCRPHLKVSQTAPERAASSSAPTLES